MLQVAVFNLHLIVMLPCFSEVKLAMLVCVQVSSEGIFELCNVTQCGRSPPLIASPECCEMTLWLLLTYPASRSCSLLVVVVYLLEH